MKRINCRSKGKRIELEACRYLSSIGFPTERAARNGVRNGCDLITPTLRIHIEVKGDQRVDLGSQALDDALQQAFRAAGNPVSLSPYAVLWKKNRSAWRLTVERPVRCTFDTDGGIKAELSKYVIEGANNV